MHLCVNVLVCVSLHVCVYAHTCVCVCVCVCFGVCMCVCALMQQANDAGHTHARGPLFPPFLLLPGSLKMHQIFSQAVFSSNGPAMSDTHCHSLRVYYPWSGLSLSLALSLSLSLAELTKGNVSPTSPR